MERLTTHKNLVFSERELLRYLKTVERYGKIDDEILATLTFKHSYQKNVVRTGLFITFPYKEGAEKELDKAGTVPPEMVGNFIRRFSEENSPIDSILINQRTNRPSFQKPLQIKIFGKAEDKDHASDDILSFLSKYSTYAPTDVSLIIFSQKPLGYEPEYVADWLEQNKFPFHEVVFIEYHGNPNKVGLYRLKYPKSPQKSI